MKILKQSLQKIPLRFLLIVFTAIIMLIPLISAVDYSPFLSFSDDNDNIFSFNAKEKVALALPAPSSPSCSKEKEIKKGLKSDEVKPGKVIKQIKLDNAKFLKKLQKDSNFIEMYEYANELGFIKFNQSLEVTYDNGMVGIITTLVSNNGTAIFLSKISANNQTVNKSFLAKIERKNGTLMLTMFNRKTGTIIDILNGSVMETWGHGTCDWLLCMGKCAGWLIEYDWIVGTICGTFCLNCIDTPNFYTCSVCFTCISGVTGWCLGSCGTDACSWYPCFEDCDDRDGYYGSSWDYYCDGDNRMKHRKFWDYYCPTNTPGIIDPMQYCYSNVKYIDVTCDTCPCTYGCNQETNNCRGAIACSSDLDCGEDGWTGGGSTCYDDDVYQNYITYTCYNEGTESSYCDDETDYILKQECTSGNCSNGECVTSEYCEDPDWWCNGGCWGCPYAETSKCCPDSGDPTTCCWDVGPYCDTSTGGCDTCGGNYPYECDTETYDCWGCFNGEEPVNGEYVICCPASGNSEDVNCCNIDNSVCMSDGSCCSPSTETCNNQDDNCDGTIDSFSEGCGLGACADGTRTCTAGSWGSCSTAGLATDEICNNIDDDCDGSVDESLTQECGTDVGACVKGTQTCSAGDWSECGGSYVGPTNETCNSIDDNCNGLIDEANVCSDYPNVTLAYPPDNYTSITGNIDFNCSVVDDSNLLNISFYHNISGNFTLNQSMDISGTYDSSIFTVNGIENGSGFVWSCLAYDDDSHPSWADAIYHVNVSIIANEPPNLSSIDNITAYEFDLITVTAAATDPENDSLTYSINDSRFTQNNNVFTWQTGCVDAGDYTVNVTVSDGSLTDSEIVTITLLNNPVSELYLSDLEALYPNSGSSRTGMSTIFGFTITNCRDSSISNISWQLNTGENDISSTQTVNLTSGEDALIYVEDNYTIEGTYIVSATTTDGNLTDSESMTFLVGDLLVADLGVLYSNETLRTFGFTIINNLDTTISNISWSLDTGESIINSIYNITLLPGKYIFVYVEYDYTNLGDYTINATARNPEASFSSNISIEMKDIGVNNLETLYANYSTRLFGFRIRSYSGTRNISWEFDVGDDSAPMTSNYNIMLNKDDEVFIYIEYDYNNTGSYIINATAVSGILQDSENITINVDEIFP